MTTSSKAKCGLLAILALLISGCQQKPEVPLVDWKPGSSASAFLDPEIIPLSGYRIKPPKYYTFIDASQSSSDTAKLGFNNYAQWITWVYKGDASERKQFIWFDSRRPAIQNSMGPIAPGSAQLVPTQVYTIQPYLKLFVQDAPGKNSEETPTKLYQSFIGRDPNVGERNFSHSPPEFGSIGGIRFARGTWKVNVGLKENVAGTSLAGNKHAPVEGICYVTVVYGQAIMFVGMCPAGESMEAIKESILSFHKV